MAAIEGIGVAVAAANAHAVLAEVPVAGAAASAAGAQEQRLVAAAAALTHVLAVACRWVIDAALAAERRVAQDTPVGAQARRTTASLAIMRGCARRHAAKQVKIRMPVGARRAHERAEVSGELSFFFVAFWKRQARNAQRAQRAVQQRRAVGVTRPAQRSEYAAQRDWRERHAQRNQLVLVSLGINTASAAHKQLQA